MARTGAWLWWRGVWWCGEMGWIWDDHSPGAQEDEEAYAGGRSIRTRRRLTPLASFLGVSFMMLSHCTNVSMWLASSLNPNRSSLCARAPTMALTSSAHGRCTRPYG